MAFPLNVRAQTPGAKKSVLSPKKDEGKEEATATVAPFLQAANDAIRRNNFKDAATAYSRAVQVAPRNPMLRLALGVSLAETGTTNTAIVQFRRALHEAEDDVIAALLLQNALNEQGEVSEAQEIYLDVYRRFSRRNPEGKVTLNATTSIQRLKAAQKTNPDTAIYHLLLGDAYQLSEQWADADTAYQAAIKLAPNWAKPRVNQGLSQLAQGRANDAIRTFEKALALNPRSIQAQLRKADAELRSGKKETALRTFQFVAARPDASPEARSQAMTSIGIAFANTGENEKAVKTLDEAQQIMPNDPTPSSLIGEIQLREGDYDAAAAAYNTALKITRDGGLFAQRPVLYRSLAEAWLSAREPAKARNVLEQALRDEPGRAPLWHRLLAHAYEKENANDNVLRHLRAALDSEKGPYPLDTLRAIDAQGFLKTLKTEYTREHDLAATGTHQMVSAEQGILLTLKPDDRSPEKQMGSLVALTHIARYQNDAREEIRLRKELTTLRVNAWDWFLLAEVYDQRVIEPASARAAYLKALEIHKKQGGLNEAAVKWARQRNLALTAPAYKP